MIAEMLLYDFNHLEWSLEKLQTLAEEFPESKFAAQSLYVLSYYKPNEDWRYQLETHYPYSDFLNQDSVMVDTSIKVQMEIKRDYAWFLAEKSYEKSYREFRRLYDEEKDTLSAYISSYISDYYLNDMGKAVEHYQAFADSFPDHSYFPQVDNRLKIIETDLEIQKAISQQGINYKYTVQFFQEEKDFDSTKVLLNEIAQGENSHFKDAANRLQTVIRNYQKLVDEIYTYLSPIEEDSVDQMIAMPTPNIESKKDSLIYLLAELFSHKLVFKDSASYYHKELVSTYTDSKYRPYSLMALKALEPSGEWGDILATEYPDTSFAPDSTVHQLAYFSGIYQDNFLSKHEELILLCDTYLELFPELIDSSLFLPDTTIIIDDSLVMQLDSMLLPADSLKMSTYTTHSNSDTTSKGVPDKNKEIEP